MLELGKTICDLVHEKTGVLVQVEMTEGYPGDSLRLVPHLVEAENSLGWTAVSPASAMAILMW